MISISYLLTWIAKVVLLASLRWLIRLGIWFLNRVFRRKQTQPILEVPPSIQQQQHPWQDLPRRLTTICIGIPVLWMLWCSDVGRVLFFQCVHVLCCVEWTVMKDASLQQQQQQQRQAQQPQLPQPQPQRRPQQQQPQQQQQPPEQPFQFWVYTVVSSLLINLPNDQLFLFGMVVTAATAIIAVPQHEVVQWWLQGLLFVSLPFRAWLVVSSSASPDSSSSPSLMTCGFVPTVSLLLTVWNCDTGALVTGRWWGNQWWWVVPIPIRSQLRRISPHKSVEGLCGGVVAGVVTYTAVLPAMWRLVHNYHIPMGRSSSGSGDAQLLPLVLSDTENKNFWLHVKIGLVLSLAAVLGDLCESALKRQYAVKDTGRLLPGHGGVLDRFDSSLVAVLFYLYYLQNFHPGRGY